MPVYALSVSLPQTTHEPCNSDLQDANEDAQMEHGALRASWLPLLLASAVPRSSPGHALAKAAVDSVQPESAPQRMSPEVQSQWVMRELHAGSIRTLMTTLASWVCMLFLIDVLQGVRTSTVSCVCQLG